MRMLLGAIRIAAKDAEVKGNENIPFSTLVERAFRKMEARSAS
jgi:hypothetical protein